MGSIQRDVDKSNASETNQGAPQDKQERSELRALVRLVGEETNQFETVFRDGSMRTFVRIRIAGRLETLLVSKSSKSTFARWLTRNACVRTGTVPSTANIESVCRLLEAQADEKPLQEAALRIWRRGTAICLDLADDNGRIVVVKPDGWVVTAATDAGADAATAHDAPFVRPATMLPLPVPSDKATPKTLERLFTELLPGVDAVHRPLVLMWLLAALRPGGPFPILALNGAEGSGKSVATDVLQKLIDPSSVTRRSLSSRAEASSIFRMASKAHVLACDNVSGQFNGETSDALCQISTGGTHTGRVLFTDDDEYVTQACRPVITNGIDTSITRPDALSRTLQVELEPIGERERKTEAAMKEAFKDLHAVLLGALLDALAAALDAEQRGVAVAKLPRLSDVGAFVIPAENALGLPPGAMARAIAKAANDALDTAMDASPLARAVLALMHKHVHTRTVKKDGEVVKLQWRGTYEELYKDLNNIADDMDDRLRRSAAWPQGHTALNSQLRRIKNLLAQHHVTYQTGGRQGHNGTRIICIDLYSVSREDADNAA